MKRALYFVFAVVVIAGSSAFAGEGKGGRVDETASSQIVIGGGRTYLGVELSEVNRDEVQRLRLREERGALITSVVADSPASRAGLLKDDVVISWGGERVDSALELRRRLRETPPGRTVRLGVIRDGRQTEVDVNVSDLPQRSLFRVEGLSTRMRERGRLGVELESLGPQMAEYFGLSKKSALLISSVLPDSPAAKAGLKAGDVILSIGGSEVDGPFDVIGAIRRKGEGAVDIKVLREKQERSFTVVLEASDRPRRTRGAMTVEPFEPPMPPVIVQIPEITTPEIHLPEIRLPAIRLRQIEPMVIPVPRIEPLLLIRSRRVVVI
jgi:serine protease Do